MTESAEAAFCSLAAMRMIRRAVSRGFAIGRAHWVFAREVSPLVRMATDYSGRYCWSMSRAASGPEESFLGIPVMWQSEPDREMTGGAKLVIPGARPFR